MHQEGRDSPKQKEGTCHPQPSAQRTPPAWYSGGLLSCSELGPRGERPSRSHTKGHVEAPLTEVQRPSGSGGCSLLRHFFLHNSVLSRASETDAAAIHSERWGFLPTEAPLLCTPYLEEVEVSRGRGATWAASLQPLSRPRVRSTGPLGSTCRLRVNYAAAAFNF